MLVKSIHIKNFRCFGDTKAKNFGHVNLLGGKNNSGKTALLEALLLANQPNTRSIFTLLKFRVIDSDFMKEEPQRAWDNFFFNGKKNIEINFLVNTSDSEEYNISISRNESVEEFIDFAQNSSHANGDKEDLMDFAQSLDHKDVVKSVLNIKSGDTFKGSLIATESTILRNSKIQESSDRVAFIPVCPKVGGAVLAGAFDKAKFNDTEGHLLEAFKLIDDSIEKVDTFQMGNSAIYLKRKHQEFMPLSLFGDAMNRVADIILRIINNENSIVLIDEIENGIHHTNQRKIWEMLFKLSLKFKVQIFATTHSEEMIEAFKDVVKKEDYDKEARYFELARHRVTDEIIVQKLSIDVLEEKLVTNRAVRGE